MLLLLFVVVGSFRHNPKTRKQVVYVHLRAACLLGKYCCCGSDQFARPVHRGVGGSPRVMVQHTRRVVVGATSHSTTIVPPTNHSITLLLLSCVLWCVVRDRLVVRDFMRALGDYFF